MTSLDYNDIANMFDRRYELYDYPGIQKCLREFISGSTRPRVLEIGCGTGKWLALLVSAGCEVAGIERSEQMLVLAQSRVIGDLRIGTAEDLPWHDASFDRVVYINVLHHLTDPAQALRESFRVLRPGGALLSVGLDPHHRTGRWYIYDYFPRTLDIDLGRFPSCEQRTFWLLDAGFIDVVVSVAEHLQFARSFHEAVQDGVLDRSFTSQLGLLSPDEYEAGMHRIRESSLRKEQPTLDVDLELYATKASKPL